MGMIGRALDELTPEQRGRILTTEMRPCSLIARERYGTQVGPCLIGVMGIAPARGARVDPRKLPKRYYSQSPVRETVLAQAQLFNIDPDLHIADTVHSHYDALCGRYGYQRVNGWIRDRVVCGRKVPNPELVEVG